MTLCSRRWSRRLLVTTALASCLVATIGYVARDSWAAPFLTPAAATAFLAFVLLAWSTGFYRWWPNRDEREKAVLANADFLVYHYAMGLIFIAANWYFMAADRLDRIRPAH